MQVDTSNPQLLILGNGFDMAAGLASGFKDFFDSRQGMSNAGEYLNTAWDEIFAHCAGITHFHRMMRHGEMLKM